MKTYIGTKIIKAERSDKSSKDGLPELGYKVMYPDGYISWSPKEIFEAVYREISESEKELFLNNA